MPLAGTDRGRSRPIGHRQCFIFVTIRPGEESIPMKRRQRNRQMPADAGGTIIRLEGVAKTYATGRVEFPALRGVDLSIGSGEMVAIVGPSGSGKTTLGNLIAGIDRPTEGSVTVNGSRLDLMSEEKLAAWRGKNIGVVFQFFQLLPTLTAAENAVLPLDLARMGSSRKRKVRAHHNLAMVGLEGLGDRLPIELSGGQQQRVAIARALACEPRILLGDEPTGNLDSGSAQQMFELLAGLHRSGTTVVYVTHDLNLAALASRMVTVRDGLIVADTAVVS
jgi:putative ABC transport system ATP-binding protein